MFCLCFSFNAHCIFYSMCVYYLQLNKDAPETGIKKLVADIKRNRYMIYLIVYFWKIVLAIVMVTMIYSIDCHSHTDCLKTLYGKTNIAVLNRGIFPEAQFLTNLTPGTCSPSLPYYVTLVNIGASYLCYM